MALLSVRNFSSRMFPHAGRAHHVIDYTYDQKSAVACSLHGAEPNSNIGAQIVLRVL